MVPSLIQGSHAYAGRADIEHLIPATFSVTTPRSRYARVCFSPCVVGYLLIHDRERVSVIENDLGRRVTVLLFLVFLAMRISLAQQALPRFGGFKAT